MSFIILTLIIILLYAVLSKYSNIYKVIFMTAIVCGMTSAFLFYGIRTFSNGTVFVILNTEMNKTTFVYACVIWSAADILVIIKMVKNFRNYVEVNS